MSPEPPDDCRGSQDWEARDGHGLVPGTSLHLVVLDMRWVTKNCQMCEGKTQINLGTRMKGSLRQRRAWPNKHMGQGGSYLHFLYHLLAKRADLGGTSDYHVLRTLILAGDPVEGAAFILDVGVEVCLEEDTGKTSSGQVSQQGPCWG